MTGKDLYRIVGQIDDSLILDANREPARARRPSPALWGLAAAACLCLVCLGVFQHLRGTSLVWREAEGVSVSRTGIPEGSTARELTRAEAEDYFQLGSFPDRLGRDLELAEPGAFYIYTGAGGDPVYDSTQLWYGSADGAASAGLTLERVSARALPEDGLSRLRGAEVYLTAEEGPGYAVYTARWERSGTALTLTADGLDRAEFITLLEELLPRNSKICPLSCWRPV